MLISGMRRRTHPRLSNEDREKVPDHSMISPQKATAALLLFASCDIWFAEDPDRATSIIDGDTFEIHGMRIRLSGLDAQKATGFALQRRRQPTVPMRRAGRERSGSIYPTGGLPIG
jgi:endonuclease YncB( thermonuclease family)